MNQMDVNPIINGLVFLNPFIMSMDSSVNKKNSRCKCDICGDSYIITAIYTLSACIHFFKFPHFGSNECSTAFDNIINDALQHAFVHKHTHFLPAITLFVHHLSSQLTQLILSLCFECNRFTSKCSLCVRPIWLGQSLTLCVLYISTCS